MGQREKAGSGRVWPLVHRAWAEGTAVSQTVEDREKRAAEQIAELKRENKALKP